MVNASLLSMKSFMSLRYQTLGFILRSYRSLPTLRLTANQTINEADFLAIESVLEVRVDKEFVAAFVCSPGLEEELAIGYLLSTGIIGSLTDISKIRHANHRCNIKVRKGVTPETQRGFSQVRRFIGTECSAPEVLRELRTAEGVPSIIKTIDIELSTLFEIAGKLRDAQTDRKRTGAFHGALIHSLADNEYVFAEDIGRHNAVDKTIGQAARQGFDLTKCLVFTSGRLTADIVSKCAWTSIPLLVSFSVSTDAGVKFAQRANLTLVGAFKGRSMRVYNQGACEIISSKE